VLEKLLQSRLGENAVEVIDLARTGIALEIGDLALSATELKPDAVVLFCGNNWKFFPIQREDMSYLSGIISNGGAAGYKEYAEQIVRRRAQQTIKAVASWYANKGIPLLWIIPEFNLGEWRDPVVNAPYLPAGNNREWLLHKKAGREALYVGDFQAGADAARRMIDIDEGTNAAGFYLLAESSRGLGDLDMARHSLELARDACIWDSAMIYAPRCFSLTQNALREQTANYKVELVDTPKLFSEYLSGGIPDRRLFIDYCHLTSEGIRVTMAAAASSLLRSLKRREVAWRDMLTGAPAPTKEVESEARFLAAIHNAHWWQGCDLVQYCSSQAVSHSPRIGPVMKAFLDLQTRRAPMLMCRSAEQIVELASAQIQHYLFRYTNQQLDQLLLATIVDALKGIGGDVQAQVDQLRVEEHSVAARETNLLDYYYNSSANQAHEVRWVTPLLSTAVPLDRDFYVAFSEQSKFIFVGQKDCPVTLDLTCRIPYPERAEETVAIYLNDEHLGDITCGTEWGRYEIAVPTVKEGLNHISICWPLPEFRGADALDKAANDIVCGRVLDLYCPFGEIHSFTASGSWKLQEATASDRTQTARSLD
jgi:hypothetical protein